MVLPDLLTGFLFKGAEHFVARSGDKEETACRGQRPPIRLHTRHRDAAFRELREFSQRNTPAVFAGIEVDRIEGSPRRSYPGVAFGVNELIPFPDGVRGSVREREFLLRRGRCDIAMLCRYPKPAMAVEQKLMMAVRC